MKSKDTVIVFQSVNDADTWFLVRESGHEVVIKVNIYRYLNEDANYQRMIRMIPSVPLTEYEIGFIEQAVGEVCQSEINLKDPDQDPKN